MKGLIIRSPYIEKILAGRKTWEIRSRGTKVRGKSALIQSGSCTVLGTAQLVDCIGPLSLEEIPRNARKAGWKSSEIGELPYEQTFALVLKNAHTYARPIRYTHPQGAVIWVRL